MTKNLLVNQKCRQVDLRVLVAFSYYDKLSRKDAESSDGYTVKISAQTEQY
jgi:hypothetical protein